MMKVLAPRIERTLTLLTRSSPLSLALVRLGLGLVFTQAGYGKLTHLARTTEFFSGLGIPFPGFHAAFVGGVELVGGALLIVGLATRFVAVGLAGTMLVALATALVPEAESWLEVLTLSETLYLFVFFFLAGVGAGDWSLDRLVVRTMHTRTRIHEVTDRNEAAQLF